MPLPRIPATLVLAALVLVHSSCAAQYGTRETFESGRGDVEGQLRAAEQELRQQDAKDAARALDALSTTQLTPRQQALYQALSAEEALMQEEPLRALQALPPPGTVRDAVLAARIEQDRAEALFGIGDAVGGAQTLVALERTLTDPAERDATRAKLWSSLLTADLDSASGPRLAQTDRLTRGWVSLAVLARSVWTDPADLQRALGEWRAANAQHPALARIGEIKMPETARRELGHVALLLPLSGAYAASGEAVRDGYFAAYYAAEGRRPAVRVYDTGSTADRMLAAWREALDNGAEFIVGPLRREDVIALAERGRPAAPVLALNYLDPGRPAPFNFYQWGLAPEDEARQAAERAIADRQFRAVALVPEGDWGDRILKAFTARLQELGGTVLAAKTYTAAARDHSEEIRSLLALDASHERHRSLTATLGVNTQFEPRRRDDVDLVFVGARPDQAKLIGPQLRFHRSGTLPIYATSAIYDGETLDPDLAGLRFCDMPWMLQESGPWASLRGQLKTLFPGRARDYTRLLALGYDAFTLVSLIEGGQLRAGSFFPAASGTLALRDGGVISRGLSCAEMRANGLRALDAPGARAAAR